MIKLFCAVLLWIMPMLSIGQIISTIAGGGGAYSDGVPATSTRINNPVGVLFNRSGELIYSAAMESRLRKIDVTGNITTIAGVGSSGYSGDSGPASIAQLHYPTFIVLDSVGNIFFSDALNNVIRKIDFSSGIISTICGDGTSGYSGDGGPASLAQLYGPSGLCFDRNGNLLIADCNNHVIRKIATSGVITTIAGTGSPGYSFDGITAELSKLYFPSDVKVGPDECVYIADESNERIRKIDRLGVISTFCGNGNVAYIGDEVPATLAQLNPVGLAFNMVGDLFVTDRYNNRIYKIDKLGMFHVVAGNGTNVYSGDGGAALSAGVYAPLGITFDSCSNLVMSADFSHIRKIAFNPECLPISVPQITADAPLSIHPNPATNHLSITYAAGLQSVFITDMLGRTVLHQTFTGQHAAELPLQLSPGCYTIIINQSPPQKLIIQ